MADIDLSTVPLSALTAEIKRRRDEWESAQKDLVGFGSAPVAVTKRARHVPANTMSAAATDRWAAWYSYKKSHPNAKPKEYWAARRKEKA